MQKFLVSICDFFENIGKTIVSRAFKLVGKELKDEQWNSLLQFVKFGLIGVSNTLISYIVLIVCVYVLNLHYLIGNVAGFIISVLNAFYWNNKYVFKTGEGEQRVWWQTLLKTYMSYAFSGLFLTSVLMYIWVDLLGIPVALTVFLNVLVCTPINFVINKLWAFKGKSKDNGKNEVKRINFSNCDMVKLVFYVIMGVAILAFIAYCILYDGNPLVDILFIDTEDTFMDFFNSLYHVKDLNPYGPAVLGIYPALSYVFYAVFMRAIPRDVMEMGGFAVRGSQEGQLVFIIYMVIAVVMFSYIFYKNKKGKEIEKVLFILGLFFTTPFIFTFERGNSVLYAMIFMAIYIFYYDSDSKGLRELAYISLAVAASIKIYPAILGLLLIKDKRYKDAIRCVIYGVVIFVVPFIFFGGFTKIFVMLKSIFATNGAFNALGYGYKVNMSNTLNMILAFLGINNSILNKIINYLPYLILIFSAIAACYLKVKWKAVALLSSLLVAVPGFSYIYSLIFMTVPVILFLDDKENRNKLDWVYMLLFAAQFIPVFRGVHSIFGRLNSPYPVTMGTFVESMSIFAIVILLTIEGYVQMYKQLKKH